MNQGSYELAVDFVTPNGGREMPKKHDLAIWEVICEIGASYRQHGVIMSLVRTSYEEKW